MPAFTRLNTLTGWSLFLLTTIVYALAVEPTASFWDCGEFIAAAYKLQIPHPSGAPLFLLLGRLFSLFAQDVSSVAVLINGVSVLSSSFTVLFLYWSIVLLARKLGNVGPGMETPQQSLLLIGSGVVGALAFAFSDSFWFSAEEAEVYALSSFFVALVFWTALRWECITDPQQENKWLILIAYLIGLSIGAHLLNLLCLPAMALIYYFKKHKNTNVPGAVVALLLGFMLVGLLLNAQLTDQALHVADTMATRSDEMLEWQAKGNALDRQSLQTHLFILNYLSRSLAAAGYEEKAQAYHQRLARHYGRLQGSL